MPTQEIEKARAFLQAIASRNADLAARQVNPDKYVEHNPDAADGVASLRAYVGRLPQNTSLEVLRAFQDGAFVLTQAQGEVLGRQVLFDVFRFEGGSIVEHWAFSSVAGPPNRSGHTQADGPTEPRPGADTETNKALVRDYYETVHLGGEHDRIREYMSGELQIRHEPGVQDGVAAFEQDLAILTRDRTIDEIKLLLGQGDFVFIAAKGTHEGKPCVYIDLYRVENAKLAEHWGFPQAAPRPEDTKNANGLL